MIVSHDIHIHTSLSRCGRSDALLENYIEKADTLGLKLIGISDHMWDDTVSGWETIYEGENRTVPFYEGQNVPHVLRTKDEISSIKTKGIKILSGAEVEYDYSRHDLAITEENARKFDYIIFPNSHTHMVMPKEFYADKRKHIEFMYDAFMDVMDSPLRKYVVAMAHPFCAVMCPYGFEEMLGMITDEKYRRCYGACAENGIAVEINLSKFRGLNIKEILTCNNIRQFRIAKECGCKFTFGSDSHTMSHLDSFHDFYVVSGALNLSMEDLSPFVRQYIE